MPPTKNAPPKAPRDLRTLKPSDGDRPDHEVYLVETEHGTFAVLAFDAALTLSALTASEAQVAQLVIDGYSNAAIAKQRRVSTRTIINQLSSIYSKLGVASRRELKAQFSTAQPL